MMELPATWTHTNHAGLVSISYISILFFISRKKSAFFHSCKMRLNSFFLHLKKGREIHYMLESRLFVEGYFCIIIIILILKLDSSMRVFHHHQRDEWMRNKCNVKKKLINAKVFMRSKKKKMFTAYNLQL